MQRLTAPDGTDDGAIAVIVTLMLVIVFGLGALVIDGGNLYAERRQLQNAADASALALAAQCAEDLVDCAATTAVLAAAVQPFADGNANDARTGLPPRALHGTDPAQCELGASDADNPLTGANVVKVSTETVDATNGDAGFVTNVLGPLFGVDTTTVHACATAEWGFPQSLSTIPLVISTCEFDLDPPVGPPTETFPGPHPNSTATTVTLKFHQGTGGGGPGGGGPGGGGPGGGPASDECHAQAGMDTVGDEFLPAGFGWLENDDTCAAVTTSADGSDWVSKDPGNNPECSSAELHALLGTVIQVPVFDDFCRPSQHAGCPTYDSRDKYRISTYASFYLQGYRFPGASGGAHGCNPSQSCLTGYFTTSTVGEGELGGPAGGVVLVRLTG